MNGSMMPWSNAQPGCPVSGCRAQECPVQDSQTTPGRDGGWSVSDRLSAGGGAYTDRCNQSISRLMTFVLALSTPQTVFMVLAGEFSARAAHRALGTDRSGQSFPAFTSLGSLCCERKEQVCETAARSPIHPPIFAAKANKYDFSGCHDVPLAVRCVHRPLRRMILRPFPRTPEEKNLHPRAEPEISQYSRFGKSRSRAVLQGSSATGLGSGQKPQAVHERIDIGTGCVPGGHPANLTP